MAQTVSILPFHSAERERLFAIAADRNRARKHVQRAEIILLSAERLPVAEIARRAGVSRPAVWRWQARYAERASTACCATRRASPVARPWP
jgi:DNA invertase Pin-like site-specific DNA recombinase